ncbi:MAG: AraC family transcriptional regulator [Lentisphaerae bacterium]|jgi:AraC-like DNA-binding protein|nr:AraC family transcriptional regulator [Lentisphaerota bacterium]
MHEKKYARRSLVDYESIRLPVYIREVGYKTYEDGDIQDAPPQRHSFFEMLWCSKGVGEIHLYKEPFLIKSNDVFFYFPKERHYFVSLSDGWQLYWLTFDGPAAYSFFTAYQYPRKMHSKAEFPYQCFEEIMNTIGSNDPLIFRGMLSKLCNLLALAGADFSYESNYLARVGHQLLLENISNPLLTVNYLAQRLRVHRTTFEAAFKSGIGFTPGSEIRHRRNLLAQELLRHTHLTINEISQRCGFNDTSSFCRFFQKHNKVSPLQYRKTLLNTPQQ